MYYKLRQACITNLGSFVSLQIRANVVINWGSFIMPNQGKCCYELGQLLQIRAAVITKQGSYYKLGQNVLQNWGRYYKLGQLLQIGVYPKICNLIPLPLPPKFFHNEYWLYYPYWLYYASYIPCLNNTHHNLTRYENKGTSKISIFQLLNC